MSRKVLVGVTCYSALTLLLLLVIIKMYMGRGSKPPKFRDFHLTGADQQQQLQGRWWAEGGFDSSQDDLQDVSSNNSHAEWMSQAPVFVLLVAPSHRTGSSYLGERE
ncbi:uncharacterized protein [Penaeus vannamei]|uniref:uncharacterized protein n=1 Tax=Penaeus vannamei TaxID=6689 RepID=UPI00387F3D1C